MGRKIDTSKYRRSHMEEPNRGESGYGTWIMREKKTGEERTVIGTYGEAVAKTGKDGDWEVLP